MKLVRYYPTPANRTMYRPQHPAARSWQLAVDVMEKENVFVVEASIPGVSPDDVEITYQEDVLTIKGERKMDDTINAEDYRLRERAAGEFTRSLRFNVPLNTETIDAAYNNGVLTITLPKAEEVLPRKISVKVN